MRAFIRRLAILTPAFAVAAGSAAGPAAGEPSRALALKVVEGKDSVEVELVANSAVTQQVRYEVELVGNSRARHSGDTSVAAGQTHVLSRLRQSYGDNWCATVRVTESSGESYTLTAGDCA